MTIWTHWRLRALDSAVATSSTLNAGRTTQSRTETFPPGKRPRARGGCTGLAGSGCEQLRWLTATKSFVTGGSGIRDNESASLSSSLTAEWKLASFCDGEQTREGSYMWNRLSSQERGNCPVSVQPWVALCASVCQCYLVGSNGDSNLHD